MTIGYEGRSGVVSLAGELGTPTSMWSYRGGNCDRVSHIRQTSPLLNVQFNKAGCLKQNVVGTHEIGVQAGLSPRVRQGLPISSDERVGLSFAELARRQPRPQTGHSEPGALFVSHGDDCERFRRHDPGFLHLRHSHQ